MSKLANKIKEWYNSYDDNGERFWSLEMVQEVYKKKLITKDEYNEIIKEQGSGE